MNAPARTEIGLGFQSDKPPGRYAELARVAETSGIDVISVFSDLMFQPPIAALLEVAAATSRVRLGPACWNPYSMHPYEIAGQLACLDLASQGRAYLGLARGSWLGSVGIEQPRPVSTVREAALAARALLDGEGRGFEGEIFFIEPGTTVRYPTQRPCVPLLIGTWGPKMAAIAGEIADEVKVGGSANPDMVPVIRERIGVGAARAGRPIGDIGVVIGAVTVVDEDGDAARSLARTEVAMYLAVVAELDPTVELPADLVGRVRALVDTGDDEAAGRLIPDDVLDRFAFSGTPEQVARQVNSIADAGAARVELGTPHGIDERRGVGLICDRVMPLVRRVPSRTVVG